MQKLKNLFKTDLDIIQRHEECIQELSPRQIIVEKEQIQQESKNKSSLESLVRKYIPENVVRVGRNSNLESDEVRQSQHKTVY